MTVISDKQFGPGPRGGVMGKFGKQRTSTDVRNNSQSLGFTVTRARLAVNAENQAKTSAADSVKARRERLAAERAARGG